MKDEICPECGCTHPDHAADCQLVIDTELDPVAVITPVELDAIAAGPEPEIHGRTEGDDDWMENDSDLEADYWGDFEDAWYDDDSPLERDYQVPENDPAHHRPAGEP